MRAHCSLGIRCGQNDASTSRQGLIGSKRNRERDTGGFHVFLVEFAVRITRDFSKVHAASAALSNADHGIRRGAAGCLLERLAFEMVKHRGLRVGIHQRHGSFVEAERRDRAVIHLSQNVDDCVADSRYVVLLVCHLLPLSRECVRMADCNLPDRRLSCFAFRGTTADCPSCLSRD